MEPLYTEDDLLPLSGLAHIAFCERRWALIHMEQQWMENRFTTEGTQLHEKAHSGEVESRPGVLVRRTLPLRSLRLGLSGQADIVEFHPSSEPQAIRLQGREGRWRALPVEYKRSRDKAGSIAYRLQLCAQAMCLEEMLGATIPAGAIYAGKARRREPVEFAVQVRAEVERMAARMHELLRKQHTPAALLKPACQGCSLIEICLPGKLHTDVSEYLRAMRRAHD